MSRRGKASNEAASAKQAVMTDFNRQSKRQRTQDPISLDAIPAFPFERSFKVQCNGACQVFDAVSLARALLTANNVLNPLSGVPFDRSVLERLDSAVLACGVRQHCSLVNLWDAVACTGKGGDTPSCGGEKSTAAEQQQRAILEARCSQKSLTADAEALQTQIGECVICIFEILDKLAADAAAQALAQQEGGGGGNGDGVEVTGLEVGAGASGATLALPAEPTAEHEIVSVFVPLIAQALVELHEIDPELAVAEQCNVRDLLRGPPNRPTVDVTGCTVNRATQIIGKLVFE